MFDNTSSDLFSAFYTVLSIDTIFRLAKNWNLVWDNSITAKDRFIIQRIAVFILIPIGVFFHELGHAIAIWQFGGEVVEFQWRIFWGYVVPRGNFTPEEVWWIAFSGNLISISFGILAILLIPLIKKAVVKELVYTFALLELVYSLIFYPVFSLTNFRGDWLIIYNFSIQPYPQITLGLHLLLLLVLWRITKSNWLLKFLKVSSYAQNSDGSKQINTIIETPRLILREFVPDDVKALAKILAKPEVMRFSPTGAISIEQTAAKMASFIDSYIERGYGKWAVIERQTGQLIGYCGIAIAEIEGKYENELGYRFDPNFWGQGLAKEAATACLEYALNTLKLSYVLGIVEPENHASIRVLEKIGMEFVKKSLWCENVVNIYTSQKTRRIIEKSE
jgi:RimJ/RimL family protein N-acetyltransferase